MIENSPLTTSQISDEQERYYLEGSKFISLTYRSAFLFYCRRYSVKKLHTDVRDIVDGFFQNLE